MPKPSPRFQYANPRDPTHCVSVEIYATDLWRRIRADRLEMLGRFCEHCLRPIPKSEPLDCHHVVPLSVDARLAFHQANTLLVCRPCHQAIHRLLRHQMRITALARRLTPANDNQPPAQDEVA